jgi:hypothetical protein
MIFHARGERALAGIETSLTRSDPGLAAAFERFNALTSRSVKQERRARTRKLLALVILLSLAALVAAWASVAGAGNQGSAGGCAESIAAVCPASRPGCLVSGPLMSRALHAGACASKPPSKHRSG